MIAYLFLIVAAVASTSVRVYGQVAGDAQPVLTYTKEFPNSQPDYYSIRLRENGEAEFRLAPEEKPVVFQVSSSAAQEMFALARNLNLFRDVTIESGRKVAQMGKKTLSYESGATQNTVAFNHTENPDALALTSLFERLSATQQHRDRLEYLLRFDRLGIVKTLLQVEMDLDQGRLLEPSLLVPVLEKIQANRSLVNVAHARAAQIITKIRAAE